MVRTETYEDEEKQEIAVGIMRAIFKGIYFGGLNEDAGLCTMKEFLPEEHEDPDFARVYYQRAVELMSPEDPERFGEILFPNWEFIHDLLLEAGGEEGLEEPIDLEQYLVNDLVDEMNDWDRADVEADAEAADVTYPDCAA
jgi:hypothetical protein